MKLRKLIESTHAMLDLGTVIMIGIIFAAMMVGAYIIWTLNTQLALSPTSTYSDSANATRLNVTGGFDSAVNLILVAITIFILAIAISALLLLRGRQ